RPGNRARRGSSGTARYARSRSPPPARWRRGSPRRSPARSGPRSPGHHQVAERVDPGGEAGVQRYGRAVLLDDRRTGDHVTRPEVGALEHLRLNVSVVEVHRPDTRPRRAGADDGTQRRAADRADPGDPQVDPLDLLLRAVPEAVPVQPLVRVMEGG